MDEFVNLNSDPGRVIGRAVAKDRGPGLHAVGLETAGGPVVRHYSADLIKEFMGTGKWPTGDDSVLLSVAGKSVKNPE